MSEVRGSSRECQAAMAQEHVGEGLGTAAGGVGMHRGPESCRPFLEPPWGRLCGKWWRWSVCRGHVSEPWEDSEGLGLVGWSLDLVLLAWGGCCWSMGEIPGSGLQQRAGLLGLPGSCFF